MNRKMYFSQHTLRGLQLVFCLLIAAVFSAGCERKSTLSETARSEGSLSSVATSRVTVPEGIPAALKELRQTTNKLSATVWIMEERLLKEEEKLVIASDNPGADNLSLHLAEQKKQIRDLNRQLQSARDTSKALRDSIQALNDLLLDNNLKILYLKEKDAEQRAALNEIQENTYFLFIESLYKSVQIEDMKDEMHAVYYTIGSKEELEELGVIKTSGALRLHKPKIKEEQDNLNYIRLNSEQSTYIPFYAKKITILSSHPEGTYQQINGPGYIEGIEITDPENFWRSSRHLIIMTGD